MTGMPHFLNSVDIFIYSPIHLLLEKESVKWLVNNQYKCSEFRAKLVAFTINQPPLGLIINHHKGVVDSEGKGLGPYSDLSILTNKQ